ncbi:MAG: alpha-1,4-glucan--maltose-1-phosphate maltosyltransferase [Acidimicrobiales bacterium]
MATYQSANSRALRRDDELTGPEKASPALAKAGARRLSLPGRVVISHVRPEVDCGRRPAKATVGDLLKVEADIFVDGHDLLSCEVRHRHETDAKWTSFAMTSLGNDRWRALVPVTSLGRHRFLIRARVDRFATWCHELKLRADAGQGLESELLVGAEMIEGAARRKRGADRLFLAFVATELRSAAGGLETEIPEDTARWAGINGKEHPAAHALVMTASPDSSVPPLSPGTRLKDVVFSERLCRLLSESEDSETTTSDTFSVVADPAKARFSTWYEMFPRSASPAPGRHGTFADVRNHLDYVAQMGFDVLYLPPIHPIGRTGRKGREGDVSAGPDDPGSPWAIGAAEGGHRAVHPELGTLTEFCALVEDAARRGIDVAMDLAFQASPDHPWVTEHPEWFRHRPDGSIRHAENPPKRYEDIYPLDFATPDWQAMWSELLELVRYWISQGIRVFRVDNPHTKPFAFWEWLLATIRSEAPETIFLSEAFTRPRVMEQLTKIGFTQSYTYFTWRSSKWELERYLTELLDSETADYLRPNLWPNTPDILSQELQSGGRAAFLSRLVLAATLSASYGIYGPAFELQEHEPRSSGSEEYKHSEKYEIRSWDRQSSDSLSGFVALVNTIRRQHPALQYNDSLTFHTVDNDQIIAYSKSRTDPSPKEAGNIEANGLASRPTEPPSLAPSPDIVVTVVNLDHVYAQSGWVELDLTALGVDPQRPYVMHDLLTDAHYVWEGRRNFVRLDVAGVPCHIFSLDQPARRSPGDADDAR